MSQKKNTIKLEIKTILDNLLEKIEKIDFRELLGSDTSDDLRLTNKHYQVTAIDHILLLAEKYKLGLCKHNESIYLFNGEYWSLVDTNEFKYFLSQAALKMGVPRTDAKFYLFQDHLMKQFLASANLTCLAMEKNTILVNLLNGTYEVDSGEGCLREFNLNDFLTYQLPFEFKPDDKAPLFENYLNRVLPDKGLQAVLSEYIGYIFTKHLKLEKCLLLYGLGANGKSVFFEIINNLLGKENISNFSLGNLSEEHNRALIADKLLNYGSELRGNIESDVFKQLVSSEPIQCRMKYGNSFVIQDYARLCFNCNELPKNPELSEAYFRRFIIIPFEVTIPENERDPRLANAIIQSELSGVFNWVLKGVTRLIKQNGFTKSDTIKHVINEYKNQSDNVFLFLTEESYEKTPTNTIPLKNLYPVYRSYCNNDGHRALSKTNFGKRLRTLNVVVDRKNSGIVVYLKKTG